MWKCADKKCDSTFNKKADLDEHRRVTHQAKVTVKHFDVVHEVYRDQGGNFKCPIGTCDHTVNNPRYLLDHSKICKGIGPPPPLPPTQLSVDNAVVVPCGGEVEVHDVLTKYNLAWNKRCSILICLQCHVGLPVSEVFGHGTRSHPPFNFTKDQVRLDLIEYYEMVSGKVYPPGFQLGTPCEAVEGLLCYNGYTCKLCNMTWPCKKTINNHFSVKHSAEYPNEASRKVHRRRDKCQTLYLHNHTKYFAVLPHMTPVHVGANLELQPEEVDVQAAEPVTKMLEKLEDDAIDLVDHGGDTVAEKEQANWLYVTGIHTYIKIMIDAGKTHEELVVLGEGHERVEVMVRYIAAWIDKTMKRLHETGQLIKRLCMAETSEMEDNKGLMPLQEKASVIKYGRIIATFMWYLVGQAENPVDPDYQLYNVSKEAILRLRDMTAHMTVPPKVPGDASDLDFSGITENPVGKQVSRVLCAVFQSQTGGWSKQFQTPPMQFLAFSTLKPDGSYCESSLLTHLMAALQYGTRLAFAEQYLDTPREAFNPAADPLAPIQDDRSRFEFLRKNGPGPFNYVRQLMHLVSTFVLSDALPDTTFWADSALETLEVDNKRVTISGIRNGIHVQQKMADADLAKLLSGCKMPAFDLNLYKEDPHSRKPFTNFLDHSGDEHRKYGHHLLKEWVRRKDVHGLLATAWQSQMTDQTSVYDPVLWKKSAMLDWLDVFDRLQERLYFLYHVASGQPLRGTEEMTTLIVNTRLSQRNIYLRSGRFAFLMWYHKSRNITGKNKPRMTFLPRRHSIMWFYYLAFLRPTAIFFLKALDKGEIAHHMTTKLWVHTRKGPLETAHFSNILQRKFAEGGVAKLGISAWRHVSVAIVDAHIKDHVDVLESGQSAIIDCQRGHHSETANKSYGGTGGYDVDRASEKRYKAASEAMHRFWEIDGPVQSGIAEPETERVIPAGELLNQALEDYTGIREAGTRTPFQADWLTMLFGRNHDMLVVARTGGGKSLGYMLPPLVEHTGCTVVVQPLIALVNETAAMLKEKGIQHVVFKANTKCVIANWHRVVVCTTDQAAEEEFAAVLRGCKVNRFIIDECHCYEDDAGFRKYSPEVGRLRVLNAPFIFMTATMQVGHEHYLFRLFCITNVKVFREATGRPELQFQTVRNCKWEVMISRVGKVVNDGKLVDCDRNILFIENKKECNNAEVDLKKLYPDLPITKYYSNLPGGEEEAAANVKTWWTTPKCLMIATSGFGAGINYKHVRNVLIFGLPEDDTEINKCFQQAGRAGRDLKPATVWLFQTGKPYKGSFAEKLMDSSKCIAGTFAVPLDGERKDCKAVGCPQLCLHCITTGDGSGEKRKADEALPAPLPGTQPMYLANVKRANVQVDIVDSIALEISKIRGEVGGLCGYCLAHGDETKHMEKRGLCDKIGCARCAGNHGWKQCTALPMSQILEKNSNAAFRMCYFCGLGDRQGKDQFHARQADKATRSCDSGLQNVCERFCWYFFHERKEELAGVVQLLSWGDIYVSVRSANVEQFQRWLGGRGWLGCPWANMVTLFIVLRIPAMRKLAQSYVG